VLSQRGGTTVVASLFGLDPEAEIAAIEAAERAKAEQEMEDIGVADKLKEIAQDVTHTDDATEQENDGLTGPPANAGEIDQSIWRAWAAGVRAVAPVKTLHATALRDSALPPSAHTAAGLYRQDLQLTRAKSIRRFGAPGRRVSGRWRK